MCNHPSYSITILVFTCVFNVIGASSEIAVKTECIKKHRLLSAIERNDHPTCQEIIDTESIDSIRDVHGNTPLHYAVYSRRNKMLHRLLQAAPVMINKKNSQHMTALSFAITIGSEKITACLLSHGADTEIANDIGYTPAHCAAMYNRVAILKLLIHHKANLEAKTLNNCTPLHIASSYGHCEAMELLIKHRVDIEAVNTQGKTPLYKAIDSKKIEPIRLLLTVGANRYATTATGETPFHYACEKQETDILAFFLALDD